MVNRKGKGQAGVEYPWDSWLGKKSLRLRKGKDFKCMSHSMAQQVRNAAYKRGMSGVKIKFLKNGDLVVQPKP